MRSAVPAIRPQNAGPRCRSTASMLARPTGGDRDRRRGKCSSGQMRAPRRTRASERARSPPDRGRCRSMRSRGEEGRRGCVPSPQPASRTRGRRSKRPRSS
jgi:hypothetical protein